MNLSRGNDMAVQATNDEALLAKLSAARRGYFKDPFISAFCDALTSPMSHRLAARQPMINRGTYARVSFVRRTVSRFMSAMQADGNIQVVSFGAGHDTLPFIILSERGNNVSRYIELDFADVVRSKADAMAASPVVSSLFDGMERAGDGVRARTKDGSSYFAFACDLRDLPKVREVLKAGGIDYGAPTLFITECVLVYMHPPASDALIQMANVDFCGVRAFVNYEPIQPNDPFGKQMVMNISLRGSPLLGINKYPTVQDQKNRFMEAGWQDVDSISMLDAFSTWLEAEDVRRINALEMLDEVEEWRLMMHHYCFVWARSAPPGFEDSLGKLCL